MGNEMDILDSDELIALANLDINNDQLSDALIKLKLAQAKDSAGDINAILARLYARLGLFSKAQLYFEKYLQEFPASLVEKFQYAMTHFDSGNWADANDVFDSILEQEPKHPPALYYSSLTLLKQEKSSEAEQRLQSIVNDINKENLFYMRANELLSELHSDVTDHNYSEPSRDKNTLLN